MSTVNTVLTLQDWQGASWLLRCDVPAMRAIAAVESGATGAFISTDPVKPAILFERHVFHKLTKGVYDAKYPDLSNPVPGGYGKYSEQHSRLDRAAQLNRPAALMSASWGMFQIMGFNCQRAGFVTVQSFVNAMYRGVDDHLRAFACFVHSDIALEMALRAHDWPNVARMYNGPDYRANNYDGKLKTAYEVACVVPPDT